MPTHNEDLNSRIEELTGLLGHYRSRWLQAIDPHPARDYAERLRAIGREYIERAERLEDTVDDSIRRETDYAQHVFRLSFLIERLKAARRKGRTLTREQFAELKRVAERLAERHK